MDFGQRYIRIPAEFFEFIYIYKQNLLINFLSYMGIDLAHRMIFFTFKTSII